MTTTHQPTMTLPNPRTPVDPVDTTIKLKSSFEAISQPSAPQQPSPVPSNSQVEGSMNPLRGNLPPPPTNITPKPLQLGPYIIGKNLGAGAFGKVKFAVHRPTHSKVAVKTMNRKRIESQNMTAKVKREINALRRCTHPSIMRMFEVIDTPSDLFVICEYVPGGELFEYIVQNQKLGQSEAHRLFHQLISGLDYLHFKKVVHRDLKPENLLLDDKKNLKIADFGLSNVLRDGEFLRTSCGSPNYAAPEIIRGRLYAGPEVDVWSTGVILYAMLCGRLPFDDDNMPRLLRKIQIGTFSIPNHVEAAPRDLISRILVVDPLARCTIQQILDHEWMQASASEEPGLKRQTSSAELLARVEGTDMATVELVLNKTPNYLQNFGSRAEAARHLYDILRTRRLSLDPRDHTAVVAYDLIASGRPTILHGEMEDDTPLAFAPHGLPDIVPAPTAKGKSWTVGIRSRMEAPHVMNRIYGVLQTIGFEWARESLYVVKIRPVESQEAPSSPARSAWLKLILYRDEQSSQTRYYVLDFVQVSSQPIEFLAACRAVILGLKNSSGS